MVRYVTINTPEVNCERCDERQEIVQTGRKAVKQSVDVFRVRRDRFGRRKDGILSMIKAKHLERNFIDAFTNR